MPAAIMPYLKSLLQGTNITATFVADQSGCSHDSLTRFLSRSFNWQYVLSRLIVRWFGILRNGYLIIDDTVVAKPYGRKFQEACYAYSSCLKKVVYGYHVVLLVWTNGLLTIPLSFRFYRKNGKSKVTLAQELLTEADYTWNIHPSVVLIDSWYAGAKLLDQIASYGWLFYTQFKKNRVVNTAPVSDDLTDEGDSLDGLLTNSCSGRIVRHDDKFFATNNCLATNERILLTYRLRWKIEEVFRFCKSELHLEECQARTKTAQQTHLMSCLIAYLLVQKEHQYDSEQTLYQIKTRWVLNRRQGHNRIYHYIVKELV